MRFEKSAVTSTLLFLCISLFAGPAWSQNDSSNNEALLEEYLLAIETLISLNNLNGARDKLTEALTADLRDERLEIAHSELRLLESLNQSNEQAGFATNTGTGAPAIAAASAGRITAADKTAATDLLDSLRVAIENGELDKVMLFTEPTAETNSLLNAVFNNYEAIQVSVSPPQIGDDNDSFVATLEFEELLTKSGDTAFPAERWKTHRLRIVKTDGSWQKVLW